MIYNQLVAMGAADANPLGPPGASQLVIGVISFHLQLLVGP